MSVEGTQRLPVVTYLGHCSRALNFYELDNIFLAIAKKDTWDNEDSENFIPPEPDLDATEVDGLIAMKQITNKFLVVPDENGSIEYRDSKWKAVTKEEALAQHSRWIYLEVSIEYSEMPSCSYRQIGIYSRVQRKDGVDSNKLVLLPDEIQDTGLLEIIDNRYVVTRQQDTRDVYSMIIEF